MKKSNYNIFVPFNGGTIVFNSFSGAIGIFDNDCMKKYESNSFTEQEFFLLLSKGIYIEDSFSEEEKMFCDREKGCYGKKEKFIRLWTTSACNADCYYCFEKGLPAMHMSEETAKQVVKYIKENYAGEERIVFEWFGGEPLLNTSVIDYIIENTLPFCDENNCKLQSEFITNGSLIDEKLVDKMKKWKTRQVQITLDGEEEEYNRAKAYKDKKYGFQSVINGIILLSQEIHVALRMNYTCDNFESLSALIDYLAKIKNNKISCYIYPLWDALGNSVDGFKSSAVADKNLIVLFNKLVDNGLADIKLIARLNYKKSTCKSCNSQSIAIFPDGSIGKCSETYNQKLGNIWTGISEKTLFNFWTSPEISEQCKTCKILPLCQGGCKSSFFTSMPQCHPYKNILPDILVWYVSKQIHNHPNC